MKRIGGFLRTVASTISSNNAFSSAANGNNNKANVISNKIISNYLNGKTIYSPLILYHLLLSSYLNMNIDYKAVRANSVLFLHLIKKENYFNKDEKMYMTKYLISVLFFARNCSESSRLLAIRNNLKYDERRVRQILRDRFHSPDLET